MKAHSFFGRCLFHRKIHLKCKTARTRGNGLFPRGEGVFFSPKKIYLLDVMGEFLKSKKLVRQKDSCAGAAKTLRERRPKEEKRSKDKNARRINSIFNNLFIEEVDECQAM